MSPGIARCSTCKRKLPIRVTDALVAILEIAHQKRATLFTVQCPTCRSITHIRRDDILEDDRAA